MKRYYPIIKYLSGNSPQDIGVHLSELSITYYLRNFAIKCDDRIG